MSIPAQPIKFSPRGRGFRAPWGLAPQTIPGMANRAGLTADVDAMVDDNVNVSALDKGKPPWRIIRRWFPSVGYWAGIQQHAFTQTAYRVWMPVPFIPRMGQINAKSVSGHLARPYHSEDLHVPSVFVPSLVR